MLISERVNAVLRKQLGDYKQWNPTSRLAEDLDMDSLDLVQFVVNLENEFGLDIPDDDASAITTVGEAVQWLYRQLGAVA